MKNEAIQKIKNTRLARRAQFNSGVGDEIRTLQKEIVIQSFADNFDLDKHKSMMMRLKELKEEYRNIGLLQTA